MRLKSFVCRPTCPHPATSIVRPHRMPLRQCNSLASDCKLTCRNFAHETSQLLKMVACITPQLGSKHIILWPRDSVPLASCCAFAEKWVSHAMDLPQQICEPELDCRHAKGSMSRQLVCICTGCIGKCPSYWIIHFEVTIKPIICNCMSRKICAEDSHLHFLYD